MQYELVIIDAHLIPKGGSIGTFEYVEHQLWNGDVEDKLIAFDGELHIYWDYTKKGFLETNPDQYWAFLEQYFDGGKPANEWDNRTELTARCEIGIYAFKLVRTASKFGLDDLIGIYGLADALSGDLPLLRQFVAARQEQKTTLITLWQVSTSGGEDDFDFSADLIGELTGVSGEWVKSARHYEVQVNERPE